MIRVVNKKAKVPVYKATCETCGADLECENSDTHVGAGGSSYVTCPECGNEVLIDEIDDIFLDENNVEFPKHFFHPSEHAVAIPDEEVQMWIRDCLRRIKQDSDAHFWVTMSGDTFVIVVKWEDDSYEAYVSKNFWSCSIPL